MQEATGSRGGRQAARLDGRQNKRKASKWEMYAGSDRLQRWQASRQADRCKASKWKMSAVRDRLYRVEVVSNEQEIVKMGTHRKASNDEKLHGLRLST